ncbi:mevalonate kinase [Gulosibacter sp. 10]|uniref:mevalonate kinase n=1 Tax=Gulosibacter sp. 10 TaxID=1255570 RepID=UPI00097F3BE6|nr:mevalonate kinase [Gulosibacter sp. 10]SJM63187.1 Mevalonate kinase [Gulosibacter sp. 10]
MNQPLRSEHPETASIRISGSPAVRATGAGRAHGKVILIGEHAVVYGQPAIALPVTTAEAEVEVELYDSARIDSDLYVGFSETAPDQVAPVIAAVRAASEAVGFDPERVGVAIRSTIPVGRGLGSSAAVAAAIVDAASDASGVVLSADERYELIQASERVAHGTPSGIDARTVVSDSPLLFAQGEVAPLRVGASFGFVIADTGAPSSTAQALAGVRALQETQPGLVEGAVERIGELTADARTALAAGDAAALGEAMAEAHRNLRRIDVSAPSLDGLVSAARKAGAAGAKLTGGGLGGCIIALAASPEATGELADALEQEGAARVWSMTLEATR